MIVIVNYGLGNLGSILNMLRKIGAEAIISSEPGDIAYAEKLILPGVGSFDHGMKNLYDLNLIPVLNDKVLIDKTPILGICLGMQLLTRSSEEGKLPGLGWIDADTIKIDVSDIDSKLKVPHMGWNLIEIKNQRSIFAEMYQSPRFYFVHSYHVVCYDSKDILSTTKYGIEFVSAVQKENIMGTQFHPEKSHKFGLKLIKNFVEMI